MSAAHFASTPEALVSYNKTSFMSGDIQVVVPFSITQFAFTAAIFYLFQQLNHKTHLKNLTHQATLLPRTRLMSTEAQLIANRMNAMASTGPVPDQGKSPVSR